MLTINSMEMPSPTAMAVDIQDRGATQYTNALGERLADRTAVKREIRLSWKQLTATQLGRLMGAVTSRVFFPVRYPDPITANYRTITCRATDRSVSVTHADEDGVSRADVNIVLEEK